MPKATFTVDNNYPAITYTPLGAWEEGDPAQDDQWSSYSHNGTFKVTQTADASATFSFSGTSIAVFGAKRHNHGSYLVQLDNETIQSDGYSSNPIIPAPLFSKSSLPQGQHKIVISNVPTRDRPFLDIDYITYEVDIGSPSEKAEVVTIEDTAGEFTYLPPSEWKTEVSLVTPKKGRFTANPTANVTCNFWGDAISIYGVIGPNIGSYAVIVDGGKEQVFDGYHPMAFNDIPLYEANNLGKGNHSIVVKCRPNSAGQLLGIDYAHIYTLPERGDGPGSNSSNLPPGIIAAITVGVISMFFALLTLWCFIIIRKNKRAKAISPSNNTKSSVSLVTPFILHHDNSYQPPPLSQPHNSGELS